MTSTSNSLQLLVPLKINFPLADQEGTIHCACGAPTKADIPFTWEQDGKEFRMDITLPEKGSFEMTFPTVVETLILNGTTVWECERGQIALEKNVVVQETASGLNLTCNFGGALHIMAVF